MLESWKARLLHLANTQPPWDFKQEFYALKTRCSKSTRRSMGTMSSTSKASTASGAEDPGDIQGGTGRITAASARGQAGGRVLSGSCWAVPMGANSCSTSREVSRVKPEPDTTRIEGYVEHADYGDKSVLAFPTLCVLCGEWRLLWAAGSTRAVRAAGLIHGSRCRQS